MRHCMLYMTNKSYLNSVSTGTVVFVYPIDSKKINYIWLRMQALTEKQDGVNNSTMTKVNKRNSRPECCSRSYKTIVSIRVYYQLYKTKNYTMYYLE